MSIFSSSHRGGFSVVVSIVACLSLPGTVQAASLSISSGGSIVDVQDNGLGDLDATAGSVVQNGAVGAWNVTTTTGISYPVFGSATSPQVDLNNVSISTTGTSDSIQVVFGDLFSTAPGQTSFITAMGGTVSNADISWSASTSCSHTNNPGCTAGVQAISSGFFTGEGAFAENGAGSVDVSVYDFGVPLYDLDLIVTITPNDSGLTSLASFDFQVSQVPLPAAAWLFGSALLGLGVIKRRKAA